MPYLPQPLHSTIFNLFINLKNIAQQKDLTMQSCLTAVRLVIQSRQIQLNALKKNHDQIIYKCHSFKFQVEELSELLQMIGESSPILSSSPLSLPCLSKWKQWLELIEESVSNQPKKPVVKERRQSQRKTISIKRKNDQKNQQNSKMTQTLLCQAYVQSQLRKDKSCLINLKNQLHLLKQLGKRSSPSMEQLIILYLLKQDKLPLFWKDVRNSSSAKISQFIQKCSQSIRLVINFLNNTKAEEQTALNLCVIERPMDYIKAYFGTEIMNSTNEIYVLKSTLSPQERAEGNFLKFMHSGQINWKVNSEGILELLSNDAKSISLTNSYYILKKPRQTQTTMVAILVKQHNLAIDFFNVYALTKKAQPANQLKLFLKNN